MYSLLVLATLTTGHTSADFNCGFLSKCFRSNSCVGACYGGGCGGCYGYCSGSCYGASCYGGRSCFGSCSGACYGGSCYGSSCYGSCYGSSYSYSGHGCYGCYGCYGCAGASVSYNAGYSNGYSEGTVHTAAKPVSQTAEAARLVVTLPADAKLYVDGNLTKTMDKATRVFSTPVLAQGEKYVYTLKAEVVRDGKTVTETKQVIVAAGSDASTSFDLATDEKVASK